MEYEKINDNSFKRVESTETVYDINNLLAQKAEVEAHLAEINQLISTAESVGVAIPEEEVVE